MWDRYFRDELMVQELHIQNSPQDKTFSEVSVESIEVGQQMPSLEGDKLVSLVNASIRYSPDIRETRNTASLQLAARRQVADLEEAYRFGLKHPDFIDVDNLNKLFENVTSMCGRQPGFPSGMKPPTNFQDIDGRQLYQEYAAYMIERCGRTSPQTKRAMERSVIHLPKEFIEEHDISSIDYRSYY